jgi:hypothetical protein
VDSFFVTPNVPGATSIVNLPTSYKNTTANLDLRFDVYKRTWLNLGYRFVGTDRINREVASQKDHIFLSALDTNPFAWLDLRASYERIDREISDYDFDVYLNSGQNLFQLPGLRKYDEADVVRNRFQLLANLYPWEPLVVSGTFIYWYDDFKNSPFGLLEDNHYMVSLDVDYGITERLNLHAFYSYEKYKNRQKARGEVPSQPGSVESDWFSRGEELVNTIGAGITVGLIRDKLDFDLSYSYSDVDGVIDFFTPAVATAEFPIVDETKLHILKTKFIYTIGHGLSLTFGYLWERFDYEDFNTEGFTNIPVDSGGNYNGAYLMGSLWEGYNAHVVYLKTAYRF